MNGLIFYTDFIILYQHQKNNYQASSLLDFA